MKLAAIYNVFDGEELLPASIACIIDHVDMIVIVWQDVSNFGEHHNSVMQLWTPEEFAGHGWDKIYLMKYSPDPKLGGTSNEVIKRNQGMRLAFHKGCTHFLNMDCDEFYQDFGLSKDMYLNAGHAGSVCKLETYFKKPTLKLDKPEDYFVPFIHELKADTVVGDMSWWFPKYPFYVDPTRHVNTTNVVELPIFMHHFSWVRKDIGRKIRNSSARANILNGTLHKDHDCADVMPGFFVRDYNRKLVEAPDLFNLSPIFS